MSTSENPIRNLAITDLARMGTENLAQVIAIDSQSDESSTTIPSTEGQLNLAKVLQGFFGDLGFDGQMDSSGNLTVTIPASDGVQAPKLAMMVHMDTAQGTKAVPSFEEAPAWDGGVLTYSQNSLLEVSAERYPETQVFVGDDVIHGPGQAPIGLDDKLGMSELMTLAQVLSQNPKIPHPEILLIFRPDEEIGKMEAVQSLAQELERRGVRHGYTIDGIGPFEIQTENFNASQATLSLENAEPVPHENGWLLHLGLHGCKSHGATAKAEGYLNALVIMGQALTNVHELGLRLVRYETDLNAEVNADMVFLAQADSQDNAQKQMDALVKLLEKSTAPHSWRGAQVISGNIQKAPNDARYFDGAEKGLLWTAAFLASEHSGQTPSPLLSEQSEGRQGYSNPYYLLAEENLAQIRLRIRDFDSEELERRGEHVLQQAAQSTHGQWKAQVKNQYINMGPKVSEFPELVTWAEAAGKNAQVPTQNLPIRGGTGVDPFLERGIAIANLGTGYFAPESEKEFTSKQKIAAHTLWLTYLVQEVAAYRD